MMVMKTSMIEQLYDLGQIVTKSSNLSNDLSITLQYNTFKKEASLYNTKQ